MSLKKEGVDVRGRSRTLWIKYRTSHQIRRRADKLLGQEVSDVDGNTETRKGTISVFNGVEPEILPFDDAEEEAAAVGRWLKARARKGFSPPRWRCLFAPKES